jgi:chromosome segregation ATPase
MQQQLMDMIHKAVSYYSLSTQSSGTEAKLALMIQKTNDITSELEACRSQLHEKEREFDRTRAELEIVKHDLQQSRDKSEVRDKELEELNSASRKQKVSHVSASSYRVLTGSLSTDGSQPMP